jgi:hypothetical protein
MAMESQHPIGVGKKKEIGLLPAKKKVKKK